MKKMYMTMVDESMTQAIIGLMDLAAKNPRSQYHTA